MNRELVENIIKGLVDNPDEAVVKEIRGEKIVVYEVKVAQPDIGKVIGRSGRIASALRLIIGAMTRKEGFKSYVNFNDQKRPPKKRDPGGRQDSIASQPADTQL